MLTRCGTQGAVPAAPSFLSLIHIFVPGAQPPVCKLMDYDKHRYEQSKRERELRKNQRIVTLKDCLLYTSRCV